MKKLIGGILVFLMICVTVPVMAEESSTVIGEWYLAYIDDTAVTDNETGIIIGENGDAVLSYNGNVKEVNWRMEDNSVVFYNSDEDLMYVNIGEDGTLWVDSEGSKLVFTQTQNENIFDAVDEATGVEALDFIGTWVPKTIIAYGTEYDAQEFEFTTQIRVSDGEAAVITDDGESLYDTKFDSDTLYIGDDESSLVCRLREDGCMIFDLEEDGITMTIVMEKSV